MKKKYILLTFDYELFLGKRSGTVENCLLKPTNEILSILEKHQAYAVFFADTTYLMRLEKESEKFDKVKKDYEEIKGQLTKIAQKGHYLFHHLHPHWLDAQYLEEQNQWDLTNSKRFKTENIDNETLKGLFQYSDHFLKSIYAAAGATSKPNGYRAGGLFIEPFEKVKPFFEEFDIAHEFSAVADRNNPYFFEDSPNLEVPDGKFLEFPISKIEIRGFRKIFNGICFRIKRNHPKNQSFGDGLAVGTETRGSANPKRLSGYFSMKMPLSVELLNPVLMPLYKKMIRQRDFIHFLSHPKLVTRESLVCLDSLLKYSNEEFQVVFDFEEMTGEFPGQGKLV